MIYVTTTGCFVSEYETRAMALPRRRRLGCALLHPNMKLHTHGTVLSCLQGGEQNYITLAIPLLELMGMRRLIEMELLLTWRSPSNKDESSSRWHRRLGQRVTLDGGALFEQLLNANRTSPLLTPPAMQLPPVLMRSVALVLEAPPASPALLELPRILSSALGVRAVVEEEEGGGEAGGLMSRPPSAARRVVLRSSDGGGSGGGGAFVEASVGATGRCAELILTACGGGSGSHADGGDERMLAAAIGALRASLPSGVRLEVSVAATAVLDCLRKASVAMQAELAGAASACEALLQEAQKQQQEDGGALDALDDFTRRMGALQSATDAQMSVLHRLVSV